MPDDVTLVVSSEFDGGAEGYLRRLAQELGAAGSTVRLWGSIPRWPSTLQHLDLRAAPKWRLRSLPRSLPRLPGERLRVRRLLRDAPPTVFNVHFKREQIGYTTLLARSGPVVWTEHGRFPTGLFGALASLPYRLASRDAAAIICVSEVVQRDIRRHVAASARSRLVVVDSGVDTVGLRPPTAEERQRSRRLLGVADECFLAVYISRLERSKRPDLAVAAAAAAGIDLAIAGGGTLEEEVRARAGRHLHVFGHVDDPSDLYRAADAYLFTSDGSGEGFPTVLLEAAAYGLPIVSASGHGFEDAVSAAGGINAHPEADSLAKALVRLRDDREDRVRSRNAARSFAVSRDARRWADAYSRALDEAATPPAPLRVIYFAVQDETYPRNERIRSYLQQELGADIEIVPLDPHPGFLRHLLQLTRVALTASGSADVVVLAEMSIPFALPALLLARRLRARLVVDRFVGQHETHVVDRGAVPARSLAALAYHVADRLAELASDVLLIDTRLRAARLARAVRRGVPIISLPVGAPAWSAEVGAPADRGPGPLRVLYYGNYHPLHDVPLLVTALGSMREADWTLTLIGDGEQLSQVERQVESEGLTAKVRFLPRSSPRVVAEQMQEHEVVIGVFGGSVKASTVVPNKVWQGLAADRVVVTRATPALTELEDLVGDRLLQVPPGDARALRQVLQELVDHRPVGVGTRDTAELLEKSVADEFALLGRALAPAAGRTPRVTRRASRRGR